MDKKHYSFFQNRECEYFPCHKGIAPERLNCLFCFCPLYVLGTECGGNPHYTGKGIKNCTYCTLPHQPERYDYIIKQFGRITAVMDMYKRKEDNMGVLSELEPKEVFHYFEEICAIPHGSYQEGKLSDYCVEFAKKHQLVFYQDEWNNVIMIKEASPGYEQEPPVILQGHLDMVCEKEPDCAIDFYTDGLQLAIDGDYILAKGTTLGGDDGIAVAYALAILASDTILHPKLEVVLTVCEEVGMEGAAHIDVSMLEGRQLLNLDSEEEGIMLAGCAGGASVTCTLPLKRIQPDNGTPVKIKINGLRGGHSGTEIDKGRANAPLLMTRALTQLADAVDYHLADLRGGNKDNAIPREAEALILVDKANLPEVRQLLKTFQQEIAHEYAVTDPDIQIIIAEDEEYPFYMLDKASTRQVLVYLNGMPNGIQTMSADVEGLVETSLNLGILNLEGEKLVLQYSVRSSIGSAKDALLRRMRFLAEGFGGSVEIAGVYPAWEYRRESALRDKMIAVYEKLYGKKPKLQAIHAGVECGLLAGKLPGLDCISIGPDMQAIHTPKERLSISSTKRVWEYLLEVLRTKSF